MFLMVSMGYSQCGPSDCLINGPKSMSIGQTATFSISSSSGQCSNCYDWDVSNSNGQIIGSDTNNSVQIKKNGSGTFCISVTYLDENGCHTCTKEIPGITPPPCDFNLGISPCYIDGIESGANLIGLQVTGIFPSGTNFNWTITRQTGPVATYSTTSLVQFVSASLSNRVVQASVTATHLGCSETYTRSYYACPLPDYDPFQEVLLCDNGNGCHSSGNGGFSRENKRFELYPNPTKSEIIFKGENLNQYRVTIYDFKGNVVIKDKKLSDNFNLGKENTGLYFYVITDEKGFRQDGKLIKN